MPHTGHRLEMDRERLQGERFARFHAALGAINGQLSATFQTLTGQQGDAYLSWTQERLLCFEDGVTLNIRWASLNGGVYMHGCYIISSRPALTYSDTYYAWLRVFELW